MTTNNLCWICKKNEANSGEHKFKSSLIKKMHGRVFKNEVSYIKDNKTLRLEGPNNKKIKFSKVICENCNNSITSPHDIAFDKLVNWSYSNFDELKINKYIDFKDIFGDDWFEQKRNIYKYMAKHAGCKIVTGKAKNEISNLSNFIYKNINTKSFQIKFIIKEGFNHLDIISKIEGNEGLKFISNSKTIYYQNKDNEIDYFAGMTTYNWLSIAWVHTQNNLNTNFDSFSNRVEKIIFLPFKEVYNLKKEKNALDSIDKQQMETLSEAGSFYEAFVEYNIKKTAKKNN